jgi:hypothetical protein
MWNVGMPAAASDSSCEPERAVMIIGIDPHKMSHTANAGKVNRSDLQRIPVTIRTRCQRDGRVGFCGRRYFA